MKKKLINILMVICVCIFAFSAWKLYEVWAGDQQIKQETSALQAYLNPSTEDSGDDSEEARDIFSPDWAGLQAQNPDILGWIIVPGADISYPVVQGTDNAYYLTHTALKEENRVGAVFLDYMVSRDLTSDNSIIYAHSVDIGGMFTNLDKFKDQTFFDDHPYFWLLTPEQNYRCDIFAFTEATEASAIYTVDFGDYADTVIDQMLEQAMYVRTSINPRSELLISLSTCNLDYGYHSNQRLVLSAVLTKYDEPVYADELNG